MSVRNDLIEDIKDISGIQSGVAISIGAVKESSTVVKFGHCPDAQTAVETDAWELGASIPVYVFPDELGEAITIQSSDAGDSQSVVVEVLDTAGLEVTKTVTLNGLTPVAIPGDVIAVNRAYNNDSSVFAGDISIKGAVSGNTFAFIDAREQQTTQCIYMIPSNKYGAVVNLSSSMNTGGNQDSASIFRFVSQLPGKVFRTQVRYGLQQRGTSNISSNITLPPVYPPMTRLKISLTPDSVQDISAEMSIQLIDSDYIESL